MEIEGILQKIREVPTKTGKIMYSWKINGIEHTSFTKFKDVKEGDAVTGDVQINEVGGKKYSNLKNLAAVKDEAAKSRLAESNAAAEAQRKADASTFVPAQQITPKTA